MRSATRVLLVVGIWGATAAIPAGPAMAVDPPAPIVVFDGDFVDSDWSVTDTLNNGSTQSHERRITAGNPDAYRSMRHELPPMSNMSVVHTYEPFVYDPATLGAVGGISVSFDQIQFDPPFPGAAVGSLFAVRQGGSLWIAKPDLTFTQTTWQTRSVFCLQPADFYPHGVDLPDFSASGAPMRFGYLRGNSNTGTEVPFAIVHGIDNFRVAIFGADNPECAGEPADLTVAKEDNGHEWKTQPLIPYAITIQNRGGSAASAVVTEIVPESTTFVPAASSPGWSCLPNGSAGSACTRTENGLGPGESRTVEFSVEVEGATDLRWDVFNEAFVSPIGGGTSSLVSSVRGSPRGVESTAEAQSSSALTPSGDCIRASNILDAVRCCAWCYFRPTECSCDVYSVCGPQQVAHSVEVGAAAIAADVAPVDGLLLHRLRDRVFARTRGGRRATELYYQEGAGVIEAAFSAPSLIASGVSSLAGWRAGIQALVEGNGSSVLASEQLIQDLVDFLDDLRAVADPELAAVMDRERQRLDINSWPGLTMDEVLARLDRLTCAGYETILFCGELSGDCFITAVDALLALRIAVGQLPGRAEADMDKSGLITASDALTILRQAVGLLGLSDACN